MYRGIVTKVDNEKKIFVQVFGMGIGGDFGPLDVDEEYVVGDRVLVSSIFGAKEDLVVVGRQRPSVVVNFATMLADIANRVRFDAAQTLSSAQKLIARTNIGAVASKSIILNVKDDFGAVGNGVAIDKTAFVNCFNEARTLAVFSRLVEVLVPPGNYVIDSSLNPGLCKINGYGATLTAKAGSTSFNMLVSTTQEFSICGLTVDMNKANVTYSGNASLGIGIYSHRAVAGALGTFRDVTVKNGYCSGFRLSGTINTSAFDNPYTPAFLENVTVDNCDRGIWTPGTNGVRIVHSTITNCVAAGIWADNCKNAVIDDCYVDTTTGLNSSCITSSYSYGLKIKNTYCYRGKFAGITIGGGSSTYTSSRYFEISNCHCEDNYYHGVTVDPTWLGAGNVNTSIFSPGTIVGTTCKNNGRIRPEGDLTAQYGNGIYLHNCWSVAVSGCVCEYNYSNGVALDGKYLSVGSTVCFNNGLYGIELRVLAETSSDHLQYSVGGDNSGYGNGALAPGGVHPKYDIFTQAYVVDSPVILKGTGSPEGVYSGCVGSTYRRTDGSTNTSLYVKETAASSLTGWRAI